VIAAAPNSCAGVLANEPLNEPTAVLAMLAITIEELPINISLINQTDYP
jgi:hypothetical protein